MNSEQARWILKFHRPDRPRNTERRQLQQAIDVILGEETRPQGKWTEYKLRNDMVVEYAFKCSNCKKDSGLLYRTDFCPNCGANMR